MLSWMLCLLAQAAEPEAPRRVEVEITRSTLSGSGLYLSAAASLRGAMAGSMAPVTCPLPLAPARAGAPITCLTDSDGRQIQARLPADWAPALAVELLDHTPVARQSGLSSMSIRPGKLGAALLFLDDRVSGAWGTGEVGLRVEVQAAGYTRICVSIDGGPPDCSATASLGPVSTSQQTVFRCASMSRPELWIWLHGTSAEAARGWLDHAATACGVNDDWLTQASYPCARTFAAPTGPWVEWCRQAAVSTPWVPPGSLRISSFEPIPGTPDPAVPTCTALLSVDAEGRPTRVLVEGCPVATSEQVAATLMRWTFEPHPWDGPRPFHTRLTVTPGTRTMP